MTTAVAPLTETRPAGLIASDDRARIERATEDSRSANTRAQYRSGARAWREWADINGHQPLPATPDAVAAYLAERAEQGAAASTLSAARAAIGASHRDANVDDPTATESVRRVLKGLRRQAAGRGRGQAQGLTADDCAAILATADRPRRTGRGTESDEQAAERGATDKVIVSLLFQGGRPPTVWEVLRIRDRRAHPAGVRGAGGTDGVVRTRAPYRWRRSREPGRPAGGYVYEMSGSRSGSTTGPENLKHGRHKEREE